MQRCASLCQKESGSLESSGWLYMILVHKMHLEMFIYQMSLNHPLYRVWGLSQGPTLSPVSLLSS